MKPSIDSKILAGQCLKAAKKAIVAEVVRHHLKVLKRGLEARLGGAIEAVRTIDETVQVAVQQAELIASRIEQELTVQKVDMPAPATPVSAIPPLPAPAGTQLPPPASGQAPAPFLPIALARPAGEPPPFLPRAAGGVAQMPFLPMPAPVTQLPFLPMPAPVTQPVPDGGDTIAEAPRQPWRYDPDRFAPAQASGASR